MVLVIAVLAAPALAIAAPPGGPGAGAHQPGQSDGNMTRTTYLALGAGVTLGLAGGGAFEYTRTGDTNITRGIGLLAGVPLALWGTERIGLDSHDAASWAVTVAATGLVAYGLWPLVDRVVLGNNNDSDSDDAKPLQPIRYHAGPTAILGPSSAGAGLGFSATF